MTKVYKIRVLAKKNNAIIYDLICYDKKVRDGFVKQLNKQKRLINVIDEVIENEE